MLEAVSRKRNQPAPPSVMFEALTEPNRDPSRQWLLLAEEEVIPGIVEIDKPHLVIWSTLWTKYPQAQIRFDLPPGGGGTDLRWTLFLSEPLPPEDEIRLMRRRINELINGNLRNTFDQ
jgi:hypothetical protein